jgi:hypothetical protein
VLSLSLSLSFFFLHVSTFKVSAARDMLRAFERFPSFHIAVFFCVCVLVFVILPHFYYFSGIINVSSLTVDDTIVREGRFAV